MSGILEKGSVMAFVVLLTYVCILQCTEATDWTKLGKTTLTNALKRKMNTNLAKNIILFIGDGMGMSTITAARIYKGQKFLNSSGEETVLKFEEFPDIALSKTYIVDRQVADSASSATAVLTGVKTNAGIIGLKENVKFGDCNAEREAEARRNQAISILRHFQEKGKSTGIVTTARVTHATPAAAYAHSVNRLLENDGDGLRFGETEKCEDIAYQLVFNNHHIEVVMGGGRRNFLPYTETDPEYNVGGRRRDDRNLISLWEQFQAVQGRRHNYVWNKEQFDAIDPATTESLLGLFENSHMQYEIERDNSSMGEPSIAEMTTKAIQILQKNNKGYFLLVEGGRIDHAHHDTKAVKALSETVAMEEAVIKAVEMTNQEETLIIVTADHSHVFTISGYPDRGSDITGLTELVDNEPTLDGMPFTTLGYYNGPGVNYTAGRQNLTNVDTGDPDFIYQSAVPTSWETHAGEDVPIFAVGPMSHLFHGVHEQNYIAHVMQYAACVGDYSNDCDRPIQPTPTTCPTSRSSFTQRIFVLQIAISVIIAVIANKLYV